VNVASFFFVCRMNAAVRRDAGFGSDTTHADAFTQAHDPNVDSERANVRSTSHLYQSPSTHSSQPQHIQHGHVRVPLTQEGFFAKCHFSRSGSIAASTCRDLGRDLGLFEKGMALGESAVSERERFIRVVTRVACRTLGPTTEVAVHGSYKADLCVPGSDVDIAIGNLADGPIAAMRALATAFEGLSMADAERVASPSAATDDAAVYASGEKGRVARRIIDDLVDGAVATSSPQVPSELPPLAPVTSPSTQSTQRPFSVVTVPYARVPIIKLTDLQTGVHGDIACGGGDPTKSHEFVTALVARYPVDGRRLILLLKSLVRQEGIGEGARGGISSFALYLMVAHFLSQREAERRLLDAAMVGDSERTVADIASRSPGEAASPQAFIDLDALPRYEPAPSTRSSAEAAVSAHDSENAEPRLPSDGSQHNAGSGQDDMGDLDTEAGELFVDFCFFYGHAFDFATRGIQFASDGTSTEVQKSEQAIQRGQHMQMTSPFDSEYDITQHMTRTEYFRFALAEYLARLLEYNGSMMAALFHPIYNPLCVYPLTRVLHYDRWLTPPGPVALEALKHLVPTDVPVTISVGTTTAVALDGKGAPARSHTSRSSQASSNGSAPAQRRSRASTPNHMVRVPFGPDTGGAFGLFPVPHHPHGEHAPFPVPGASIEADESMARAELQQQYQYVMVLQQQRLVYSRHNHNQPQWPHHSFAATQSTQTGPELVGRSDAITDTSDARALAQMMPVVVGTPPSMQQYHGVQYQHHQQHQHHHPRQHPSPPHGFPPAYGYSPHLVSPTAAAVRGNSPMMYSTAHHSPAEAGQYSMPRNQMHGSPPPNQHAPTTVPRNEQNARHTGGGNNGGSGKGGRGGGNRQQRQPPQENNNLQDKSRPRRGSLKEEDTAITAFPAPQLRDVSSAGPSVNRRGPSGP
jgi:DNA polymerase sigma